MQLSICEKFTESDDGWEKYINWIGLPHLHEVRTIDVSLNPVLVEYYQISSVEELIEKINELPEYNAEEYYIRLAINRTEEEIPGLSNLSVKLLGYDLADYTEVSSILNCTHLTNEEISFGDRMNPFGLLSYEDALHFQKILPEVWKDEAHAYVDIWAVFEFII